LPNIPYKTLDGYEPKEVLDAVVARRKGNLMNLDRMLLHSPPLAEGWTAFFSRMRDSFAMPAKLRELAMCAVAVLNGADYEFHHHLPVWMESGARADQVEALKKIDPVIEDRAHFDDAERAVIRLSIEMTRRIKVNPDTLLEVRRILANDQQVVELIAVIAAYNMVSRILIATGVEIE
jgi:alkylhydroperoxidase family enzyme